ncbi:MAG: ATP-binding protein [Arcicella sp.]|jgi:hypothetical protein|nr:ATP-binding protein [Arcicella sp.]
MSFKPTAYQNFTLPYNQLPSNTFVALVCAIFKSEIHQGEFKMLFDDAANVDGTNDKGRDIALYREQKNYGVIQCKRYKDDINISDFENEILKFSLHYINDNSLIYDKNDFYYYYVAPKFSKATIKHINNFKDSLSNELKLGIKVKSVIVKNKRDLKDLEYEVIKDELIEVLSKLKIKRIEEEDLENYLSKSYNKYIQTRYFELKNVIIAEPKININVANSDFKKASQEILKVQKSEFGNLNSSQIERLEVSEIFNWIKSPVGDKDIPIAVLVGKAGYGKSVIMKQLTQKLQEENIPTLSIKADRNLSISSRELQERLNLKYGIVDSVKELAFEYDRVVILFDQIDALSQSQSLKNDYSIIFRRLVNELKEQKNVRVIASVREYDLATDTEFRDLSSVNKIKVDVLSETNVNDVLSHLELKSTISKKLFELLRVPNHLDIFCQVHASIKNYSGIQTLQDLYNIFWKQIIKKSNDIPLKKVKNLLFELSKKVYKQGLSIPISIFEDDYPKQLEFLSSEGIITKTGNKIQFFHQTFYDYCYAKMFAKKNKDILEYISENNCSLEIRATLKMVLTFLREENPKDYIQNTSEILSSKNIAFHIKLLVINFLGYVESPSSAEMQLIKDEILPIPEYRKIFIESAYGSMWLTFLINEDVLNDLILSEDNIKINRWRILLMNNIRYTPDSVFDYLDSIDFDFKDKALVFQDLLYRTERWTNPIPKKLFDIYYSKSVVLTGNSFRYFHILENALNDDVEWVIDKFREIIFYKKTSKTEEYREKIDLNHSENELLAKLFAKYPDKTVSLCLEILEAQLYKRKSLIKGTLLMDDYAWGGSLNDDSLEIDSFEDGHKTFLKTLVANIKILAKNNDSIFQFFKERYKNTKFIRIQRLLLNGYIQNPHIFKNDIFDFIKNFNEQKGFTGVKTTIEQLLQKAIQLSYSFLDIEQKRVVNDIILNISNKCELRYYKDWLQDRFFYQRYPTWTKDNEDSECFIRLKTYKYLFVSAIPSVEFDQFPTLKKVYLELDRKCSKYKKVVRKRGGRSVKTIHPRAINYNKLNDEQWLKLFKKYDARDFSRVFAEQIKINPQRLISFIEQIVSNEGIAGDYVTSSLEALKDIKVNSLILRNLWVKAICRTQNKGHDLSYVWITTYFINTGAVNDDVVNYLKKMSLLQTVEEKDTDNGNYVDGINSIQGAAISNLMYCITTDKYQEILFSTLQKIIENAPNSVKCAIMNHLQNLIGLDRQKTLYIFLKLTQNPDLEVFKCAVNVAYWLAREDFDIIKPFYFNCMLFPDDKDFLPKMTESLFWLWLFEESEGYGIMNQYFELNQKCKIEIVKEAGENLFSDNGKYFEKCSNILYRFLEEGSEEFSRAYDSVFRKVDKNFKELLPFMKQYRNSILTRDKYPDSFYQYLLNFTGEYPSDCLDLIENFEEYQVEEYYHSSYLFDIILSCHKNFRDDDKLNKIRAINIFDKALCHDSYRFKGLDILKKADD